MKNTTGHVFYCKMHDHGTMGVAIGNTPVSTRFDVPAAVELGANRLYVVANGIPWLPVNVVLQKSPTITLRLSRINPLRGYSHPCQAAEGK